MPRDQGPCASGPRATRCLHVILLFSASMSALPRPASGQASEMTAATGAPDRAELARAKTLFDEGVRLSAEERWAEARDRFRAAAQVVERPSIQFNLATVLYRLGGLVEARAALDAYDRLARDDDPNWAEAQRLRRVIEPAIAHLRLSLSPADATVSVDGRERPGVGATRKLALDPGSHFLELRAKGHEDTRLRFELERGAVLEQRVQLIASPVDRSAPAAALESTAHDRSDDGDDGGVFGSPWFWTAVGAVAVGAGVIAVVANQKDDEPSPMADGGNTGRVLRLGNN